MYQKYTVINSVTKLKRIGGEINIITESEDPNVPIENDEDDFKSMQNGDTRSINNTPIK